MQLYNCAHGADPRDLLGDEQSGDKRALTVGARLRTKTEANYGDKLQHWTGECGIDMHSTTRLTTQPAQDGGVRKRTQPVESSRIVIVLVGPLVSMRGRRAGHAVDGIRSSK